MKIHFIANCVYGTHLAGGDIHFFEMARAASEAGFELNFFGGVNLAKHVKASGLRAQVTLTDNKSIELLKVETPSEQLKLLSNYARRFFGSLRNLSQIEKNDIAYAVTDYWVDTIPVLLSKARGKAMSLGMDAPMLKEILQRSRPDVQSNRLSSIYYWLSQNLSLHLFKWARTKRVGYVHPTMKPRLLKIGFKEEEIAFISNGMNMRVADAVPPQRKEFDVIWIGRVHAQKGIDDLIETISFLAARQPDLRVALVGKVESLLKPRFDALGLGSVVKFTGLVSEEEKFRLFKSSRLFLMPSRYESWGIVIAEALVCGTPVVAYDLDAYRPIFGDLVSYVPCFDANAFKERAHQELIRTRKGQIQFDPAQVASFRENCSWQAAGRRFVGMINSLGG